MPEYPLCKNRFYRLCRAVFFWCTALSFSLLAVCSIVVTAYFPEDYTEIPFGTGETLLACSDGLSNYVHAEQMYQLASRFNGEELAQQMVQTALGGGGSDNITVALIEN